MRVLLISGSFPPMHCGVGDYTYQLAEALSRLPSTNVGVLTSVDAGSAPPTNTLELFPVVDGWRATEATKVARVIDQWAPDVVHIQYPSVGFRGGRLPRWLPLIARLKKKLVVQTWHEAYRMGSFLKLLVQWAVPGGLVVVRSNYRELIPAPWRWTMRNKRYAFIRNGPPFPRVDLTDDQRRATRERYLKGQRRLVVFFGFVNPNKRVELLFRVANPATDQIVVAGEVRETRDYHRQIMALASSEPWSGKATITGFLPPADAAALLSVADAVVMPFEAGGGDWNTSVHAAVMQRAFVITTSLTASGYDEKRNTFYAAVDDAAAMKSALDAHAGTKRKPDASIDRDEWQGIAEEHVDLYTSLLREP